MTVVRTDTPMSLDYSTTLASGRPGDVTVVRTDTPMSLDYNTTLASGRPGDVTVMRTGAGTAGLAFL